MSHEALDTESSEVTGETEEKTTLAQITTSIEIDAPADSVWQVLTEFDRYPKWNQQTRIEGEATEGTTLRLAPGPEAGTVPTFHPEVLEADGRELRWLGHLFVRGLFDGEHQFVIEELDGGRCQLTQSEQFSGLLVGLIHRLTGDQTKESFIAVNEALKRRAESLSESDGHGSDTEE